jgi:hypothetical protein
MAEERQRRFLAAIGVIPPIVRRGIVRRPIELGVMIPSSICEARLDRRRMAVQLLDGILDCNQCPVPTGERRRGWYTKGLNLRLYFIKGFPGARPCGVSLVCQHADGQEKHPCSKIRNQLKWAGVTWDKSGKIEASWAEQ